MEERKRQDHYCGLLASIAMNTAPGRRKGSKTYKPSDFFPGLKGK